jgi:hypothetical protein
MEEFLGTVGRTAGGSSQQKGCALSRSRLFARKGDLGELSCPPGNMEASDSLHNSSFQTGMNWQLKAHMVAFHWRM